MKRGALFNITGTTKVYEVVEVQDGKIVIKRQGSNEQTYAIQITSEELAKFQNGEDSKAQVKDKELTLRLLPAELQP